KRASAPGFSYSSLRFTLSVCHVALPPTLSPSRFCARWSGTGISISPIAMIYTKLTTNLKYLLLAALLGAALLVLAPAHEARAKTKPQVVRNDGARFDIP